MTDLTIPFLGDERAAWQYPFRSLLDHGASLAMGSDWAVSTPDVMEQVFVATTRRIPEVSDPFLPDERISMTEALAGFTSGSSYVDFLDDRGSIDPGKVADIAVLGGNPFETDSCHEISVDLTMVGGEVVFQR